MPFTEPTAPQSSTTTVPAAPTCRIPAVDVCRAYLAVETAGRRLLNQDLAVSAEPTTQRTPLEHPPTGRFDRVEPVRPAQHPLAMRSTTSSPPASSGAVQTI